MTLRTDARGTTSLEFAAAGSVIVMLMLAIFDVGLLFIAQRGLDYGIERAARWASVNSSGLSVASVLSQFQSAAAAALPNSSGCVGYASGASIPAGTACAVTVGFPGGTTPGNVVTIQASYKWSPVSPITGFTAATLHSSVALTIQN